MRLLPFDSYRIETNLSAVEIRALLEQKTARRTFLPTSSDRKPFAGEINSERFVLKRKIPGEPILSPEVSGEISDTAGGSIVRVQMIPNAVVLAMVTAQFAALSVLIFADGWRMWVTASANVLLAWFLCLGGFWLDSGGTKRMLTLLLSTSSRFSTSAEIKRQ